MEQFKEVKTYQVDYMCDKCESGFMFPTGVALTINPPRYEHKCIFCNNVENFTKVYPTIEYK